MLRSEGGVLYLNRNISDGAIELMLKISDHVPSKISFPELSYIESQEIILECSGNNFNIGEEENQRILLSNLINLRLVIQGRFSKMVLELAVAGYPGCIGCGGPGSEESWDEASSRIY